MTPQRTDRTTPAGLPSSPPPASPQEGDRSYEGAFDWTSPASTLYTAPSPARTLGHSSPELPPLPSLPAIGGLPRTPASVDRRQSTDSVYYTAHWGSPHQLLPIEPSNRSSARRHSSTIGSDDLEEGSPDPRFGLTHLLSSRLPRYQEFTSRRPSYASSQPAFHRRLVSQSADDASIPTRSYSGVRSAHELSEKLRSLRVNTRETSGRSDSQGERVERLSDGAVDRSTDKAHIAPTKRLGRQLAWARLAAPKEEGVINRHKSRKSNLTGKQEDFWTRSSPPVGKESNNMPASNTDVSSPHNMESSGEIQDRPPLNAKTRVQWRGKSCWIRLPNDQSVTQPLSSSEVASRIENFERAGYDTRGFDHWRDADSKRSSRREAQSCRIFPDPDEQLEDGRRRNFKVRIPDRRQWEAYVNFLTEQKLRALGVSMGDDDQSTSTSKRLSLPFSQKSAPAPAVLSRAGQRGSVVLNTLPHVTSAHHAYTRSIASPVSSQGNARHMHRHSTFASPTSFPQQYTTPSPRFATRSPQFTSPQGLDRKVSPALMPHGTDSAGTLSPVSPYAHQHSQYFPFGQTDASLAQMARQQQQQSQFQSLQHQPQLQSLGLKPAPILPEVPEDEGEDGSAPSNVSRHQDKGLTAPETFVPHDKRGYNASINSDRSLQSGDYHLEKAIDKQFDDDDSVDNGPQRKDWAGANHTTESAAAKVHAALWEERQSEPQLYHPQPHSRAHSLANALYRSGGGYINDAHKSMQNLSEETTNPSDMDTNPSLEGHRNESVVSDSIGNKHNNPSHKPRFSVSKLNVDAKEFKFGSSVSSKPTSFSSSGITDRSERMEDMLAPVRSYNTDSNHISKFSPDGSRSSMNVAAPSFVPAANAPPAFPHGSFNFMFQPPSFVPAPQLDQLAHLHTATAHGDPSMAVQMLEAPNKIFTNTDFSDIVKPPRKSKAVPIVRPDSEASIKDDEDIEDEDGRVAQSTSRQKRARRADADGDSVPRFAAPPYPMSEEVQPKASASEPDGNNGSISQDQRSVGSAQEADIIASTELRNPPYPDDINSPSVQMVSEARSSFPESEETAAPNEAAMHQFASIDSLSEIAKSIEYSPRAEKRSSFGVHVTRPSMDDEDNSEGNELRKRILSPLYPIHGSAAPLRASDDESHRTTPEMRKLPPYDSEGANYESLAQPSFNEIDDVIKHLNEEGSDFGVERDENPWMLPSPTRVPLREIDHRDLPQPRTLRSGGLSPEPRHYASRSGVLTTDSTSVTQNPFSDENAGLQYESPVHRPNETGDIPASDWENGTSSRDEVGAQPHRNFYAGHEDGRIDELLQNRLDPLEKSLHSIQLAIAAMSYRDSSSKNQRSSSGRAVDSDADDEDDENAMTARYRNRSPLRDRKLEKIRHFIVEAINDVKDSVRRPESPYAHLTSVKEVVEEALARQHLGLVQSREQEAEDAAHSADLMKIVQGANARVLEATEYRRIAEMREADAQKLLKLTEEELVLMKESSEEDAQKLRALELEREESQKRIASAEHIQEELRQRLAAANAGNEALESTLDEYRLSSTKWREEVDGANAQNETLKSTVDSLRLQITESVRTREVMRERLSKFQTGLSMAAGQLADEKARWHKSGLEQREANELLTARLGAEARTRERLEKDLARLYAEEIEAAKLRVVLDETQKANFRLEDTVNMLKLESSEHQQLADQYAREFREAREGGRTEVERIRVSMTADIEAANNQVNVVRAELENELAKVRTELDNAKMAADTANAQHELLLEEKADAHRGALRDAADTMNAALQEQRLKFEQHILELQQRHGQAFNDARQQHKRALDNAIEDKQRSESYLNERRSLADAKLDHLQDKISLLEDKLETAKSAAHAAAVAAQSAKASTPNMLHLPEKISPQALRESILVLQEQLQEREGRIERLEQQLSEVDTEAPAKLKERETEIGWLRELLGVRVDDLSDLVNALAQPDFDREAVRDAAIRIRANLQMEQQEKERLMTGGQSFPSLASLSNFASPKAVQLAAAIGNWRKGRDSLVSNLSISTAASRDQTPSKPPVSAQNFLSGLMTPPTSNVRRTPRPQQSIKASRPVSSESMNSSSTEMTLRQKEKQPALAPAPETPPLMREASYDQDAEDGNYSTNGFYDDDESTVDGNPVERPQRFEPFGDDV